MRERTPLFPVHTVWHIWPILFDDIQIWCGAMAQCLNSMQSSLTGMWNKSLQNGNPLRQVTLNVSVGICTHPIWWLFGIGVYHSIFRHCWRDAWMHGLKLGFSTTKWLRHRDKNFSHIYLAQQYNERTSESVYFFSVLNSFLEFSHFSIAVQLHTQTQWTFVCRRQQLFNFLCCVQKRKIIIVNEFPLIFFLFISFSLLATDDKRTKTKKEVVATTCYRQKKSESIHCCRRCRRRRRVSAERVTKLLTLAFGSSCRCFFLWGRVMATAQISLRWLLYANVSHRNGFHFFNQTDAATPQQ